jgi:hypothetical protein
MEEAVGIARSLPVLKSSFEVRPVRLYFPGVDLKSSGTDQEKP